MGRRDRIMRILLPAFLACFATPAIFAGLIPNGSFEDDPETTWSIVSSGGMLSGAYSVECSSPASGVSFQIRRETGSVSEGSHLGIQRSLYLTGVTGFILDSQDKGIDTDPIQFLIDRTVVGQWSNNGCSPEDDPTCAWGSTTQTYNISILLADSYTGVHTLTIRY
jgi:hypothetical protein